MADYIRDLRPAKWDSIINLRNPERSLSALGLGCSLIPGARWLCRRRMLRCLGLPRFTVSVEARRVVILCCQFVRNLAYYRVGGKHPTGWKDPPLGPTASFWRIVNGNFIDVCVLEWCKLMGDAKGQHCWERVVSDKAKFKAELFKHLNVSESQFEKFRLEMREYRDKFLAHLDSELVMNIPMLDLARKSVEFYHAYVVANEAQSGDLSGLPDTTNKLQAATREPRRRRRLFIRRLFPECSDARSTTTLNNPAGSY